MKYLKLFEDNNYYTPTGIFIPVSIPMSIFNIDKLKKIINKDKRIGTTSVYITSFVNNVELPVKYITIKSTTSWCSWGRKRDKEWTQPDPNKIWEIEIKECEDEWFLVKIEGLNRVINSYNCDQIEGVVQLLKDYGVFYDN